MSTVIKVDSVQKRYGDKVIIPDLSLQIEGGEFFTLLGPSGCGKTTLLRMIAGFNSIEKGSIYFNDDCINNQPPYKRNIGMVFQNYAIFPHMNVKKNIEYGLKQRKISKSDIDGRVNEMMHIVKIFEHAEKSPEKLSGGQQQRVALARAIIIHPTVLLMDEPLSNLDAKLRVEMRSAIRDIQKKIDITTVYVTHDQEEALAVSDRIAVMNEGELYQVGTPVELYQRPANQFVATFIGSSNLLAGTYKKEAGTPAVVLQGGFVLKMNNLAASLQDGQEVTVGIRPEEFSISQAKEGIEGEISTRVFLGRYINYKVKMKNGDIFEVSQNAGESSKIHAEGETVYLFPDAARVNVFTADGGTTLIEKR